MAEISCSFSGQGGPSDRLSARLRKPPGFRGDPLFADDRQVTPQLDSSCQIRADPSDPDRLIYSLLITDFSRCGVLKRDVSVGYSPQVEDCQPAGIVGKCSVIYAESYRTHRHRVSFCSVLHYMHAVMPIVQ